jgi:putative transcriptional regulator
MKKQRRNKLISLRKEKNWLQKDVVARLKDDYDIVITESYYGMMEQGARTPSLEIALAIAKLFDISAEEIFFEPKPYKNLGERTA